MQAGWLASARRLASPHCDDRPSGMLPELVVVHGITLPPGEFGGSWIDDLFLGRLDPGGHPYFATIAHLRVSAHLLIRRDGSVTQYVPFDRRAWHAGASMFGGRERCNDFSIGIDQHRCPVEDQLVVPADLVDENDGQLVPAGLIAEETLPERMF
ncbi:MAG TPA: 1,6-anhydro-N-acetylmuramyl-L-alanine amidase AmpD, partial [Chromatiales bacterium]|nr:1,6-anhydro-N-acetylmuramyl-L-alanine amidase AmpD [Chromatiales bacterium]